MKETRYDRLDESLYAETLDNGLSVFVLPKSDFRQTYATFTTRYGSIDTEFAVPGRGQKVTVPDGVAHFLEHKMFEEERGDVFLDFARYGAQANAFTTFDTTSYLFSATGHVEESLKILLDFVQHPYFTEESVEAEKGIIGQEIRMYEDDPRWRVYFGLLQGMYGSHPAAIDIAGTVKSIAKINKDILYDCHATFYHPSNMVLFVVGPVDPQRMAEVVRENQAPKGYVRQAPIDRLVPEVPETIASPHVEVRLTVAEPIVNFGWRERDVPADGRARQVQEMAMEVGLEVILGKGSPILRKLVEDGLTDLGFSASYELTPHYGHSLIGGNSKRPRELVDRVQAALATVGRQGVDAEAFARVKRMAMGRFLGLLDSPATVANIYTASLLHGEDLFATLDLLEGLTVDDVQTALSRHVRESEAVVSIVWPRDASA
ncbi:MAG: pitrilysin family protein [Firmicutes bacterium]|nr:pitrilysin family protein [Bacillota bacterium]